ncbi:unnamed protein product, partial [Mesorhabditis belari]|uniref:Neurotransmitter-gated ion-channel ligand-binding domain-containing protein n=1 Tax=Mesorhabditis belari TaxID=2138241 RepID=A0AAF3EHG9_9BILA
MNESVTQFSNVNNENADEPPGYQNAVNNLYNQLFTGRGYNRYLSPIYGVKPKNATGWTGPKLHIHFDLWYIKLISLDAESQLLSICLQLKTFWRDTRLAWNASDFFDIEHIFVSSDAIWVPDTLIGNSFVFKENNL